MKKLLMEYNKTEYIHWLAHIPEVLQIRKSGVHFWIRHQDDLIKPALKK